MAWCQWIMCVLNGWFVYMFLLRLVEWRIEVKEQEKYKKKAFLQPL